MNKVKLSKVFAAAIVLLAVAAAIFLRNAGWYLTLSNGNTGEFYARYPLKNSETFGITFIHSVNATPVTDYYSVDKDGSITLQSTVYYDFGAGVPYDLNDGEELSIDREAGSMTISGINRVIPNFLIFVGTVSDHTLSIGGDEVSLRDLCGRNAKVRITYGFCWA